MKRLLLTLGLCLSAIPATSYAHRCSKENAAAETVTIRYLGNDEAQAKIFSQEGRYELRNQSRISLSFAVYTKYALPVLYPMDTTVQIQNTEGGWSDNVLSLSHYEAPDKVLRIKPGGSFQFFADTRDSADKDYRLGIRTPKGCWFYSAPFRFEHTKRKVSGS
ncbi:hypothetical protein [Lysobacter antibioticus]|uniref:hypothetical protein n=1 Tax=Lysobacter antibioticus TaxID=84531 RepID=UPI0011874EFA|nr:hypothetical protein [Lysobacter antibioticus]